MSREKIIFHASWLDAIEALPEDMQGKVLLGILRYGFNGEIPGGCMEGAMVQMAKPQIDADNQHFDNGSKGGRPKKETGDKTPVKTPVNNPGKNPGFESLERGDKTPVKTPVSIGGIIGGSTTTTTTEDNNYKTDDVVVDDLCARLRAETTWVEAVCMNLHKDPAYIQQRLAEFCTEQKVQGVTTKSLGDAKRHFRSWLRKVEQIEAEQSRRGEPTTNGRPYPIYTYEEMLNEITRKGGSTNDYATLYMGNNPKPLWVKMADKTKYNIPHQIAS